ncbi:hypothetical protein C8J57DRAFT_1256763 [Mycena rebaudengoi]|nr:hypothetical protein C8J57DRAFT_1256763 [Mycena rebaudengoi]
MERNETAKSQKRDHGPVPEWDRTRKAQSPHHIREQCPPSGKNAIEQRESALRGNGMERLNVVPRTLSHGADYHNAHYHKGVKEDQDGEREKVCSAQKATPVIPGVPEEAQRAMLDDRHAARHTSRSWTRLRRGATYASHAIRRTVAHAAQHIVRARGDGGIMDVEKRGCTLLRRRREANVARRVNSPVPEKGYGGAGANYVAPQRFTPYMMRTAPYTVRVAVRHSAPRLGRGYHQNQRRAQTGGWDRIRMKRGIKQIKIKKGEKQGRGEDGMG